MIHHACSTDVKALLPCHAEGAASCACGTQPFWSGLLTCWFSGIEKFLGGDVGSVFAFSAFGWWAFGASDAGSVVAYVDVATDSAEE